jgi:hypothetical protein
VSPPVSFDYPRTHLVGPTTLIIQVVRSYALEGYAVFSGTVSNGSEVVASMQIQALRPEETA